VSDEQQAEKPKREPRPARTYRASRRNAARETGIAMEQKHAPEPIDGSYDGSIELNRRPDWSRAQSYGYAREISPSKEPVR
jgi:hypothetical protein